jgi:hypothetical protein
MSLCGLSYFLIVMLNVKKLSVIMLNIIIPSAMAPADCVHYSEDCQVVCCKVKFCSSECHYADYR